MLPFEILAFGVFDQARLRTRYEAAERPSTPLLDELIAIEWERQLALAGRAGRLLFNGGLLRYVRHEVRAGTMRAEKAKEHPGMPTPIGAVAPGSEPVPFCHGDVFAGGGDVFELTVGPTCYRDFVGTNLFNHHRLDEFGWERFANPIGTTATLISSDGLICYGRRSAKVAYHAAHVHTFGGALEESDRTADGVVDPFASLCRELREELDLRADDLTGLCCVGLIRDTEIRQPELLFEARLTMTAAELGERWQRAEARDEHDEIVTLPDAPDAIVPFIKGCGPIAPVAVGALLLHGLRAWGRDWFETTTAALTEADARPQADGVTAKAWGVAPLSLKDAFDAFGYTLSLPERLVKSAATVLAGATKLLTDTIIPEPLRQTNTFAAIAGNAQRFLIEKVAEVQGVYAKDKEAGLPGDFVARKIAGNVMETAGMFSIHMSPLWVFAMASDVAQGSKVYLNRLVDRLKGEGVLAPETEIKELDGLFDALGRAGEASAKVFEAPPLSAAGLRDLRRQITDGYKGIFLGVGNMLPRMDNLWESAEQIAKRENVSVESILGLMTVDLGRTAGQALIAAFAVGQVSTELLGETVFRSYAETISRVQERGVVACLTEATKPYTEALLSHITGGQTTWTERLWGTLWSRFGTAVEPERDAGTEGVYGSPAPDDESGDGGRVK